MTTSIRADRPSSLLFVFDMDEVIYDYDGSSRRAALSALTGHDFDVLAHWWRSGDEKRAEAGGFSDGAHYLDSFNREFGTSLTASEFIANRRDSMTVRPAVVAAVARAKELGRISLLTNNGPLVEEHLSTVAAEVASLFELEHLRSSSRYGARKPDPLVFERMLAEYGADAADTFFADDRPDNVAGAASLGITAHLYVDPESLVAAIESFAAGRAPL